MKFKKILASFLVICLLSISNITAFAAETSKPIKESDSIASGKINIDKAKGNDTFTKVSEILTYDQLVAEIANDQGISKSEAANQVIANYSKNSTSLSVMTATAATYRTLSTTFTVASSYHPTLKFYCETSEGGYFHGIVKILNVGMNRADFYTGTSKQFSGTVYTNLENANKIFWIVNGDFYNNGTTSGGGNVDINLGEYATVGFNIANSSNFFQYIYLESYTNF